jgi:hypothetical protein
MTHRSLLRALAMEPRLYFEFASESAQAETHMRICTMHSDRALCDYAGFMIVLNSVGKVRHLRIIKKASSKDQKRSGNARNNDSSHY